MHGERREPKGRRRRCHLTAPLPNPGDGLSPRHPVGLLLLGRRQPLSLPPLRRRPCVPCHVVCVLCTYPVTCPFCSLWGLRPLPVIHSIICHVPVLWGLRSPTIHSIPSHHNTIRTRRPRPLRHRGLPPRQRPQAPGRTAAAAVRVGAGLPGPAPPHLPPRRRAVPGARRRARRGEETTTPTMTTTTTTMMMTTGWGCCFPKTDDPCD